MRLPVIRGLIDRRMLVNYRIDPTVLEAILPRPFAPKVIDGYGMAGICLIRLKEIRPVWMPRWLGISSENSAHRIAVEWNDGGVRREGVYVLRRDTDSRLNTMAGGRIFPGVHHHAAFAVAERGEHFEVAFRSDDGTASVSVTADQAESWQTDSIFPSLADASQFFEAGSLGYSPARARNRFDGLELRSGLWKVEPLTIKSVRSSVFDDRLQFPSGSIELDCALLMRGIEHEWHHREDLCCKPQVWNDAELPGEGVPTRCVGTRCG